MAKKAPTPDTIKNGEHMELWKELWRTKAQLEVISREIRIGIGFAVAVLVSVLASNL